MASSSSNSFVPAESNPTRDAAFSKALHGSDATDKRGFAAILGKDKRATEAEVSNYFDFWDNKTPGVETEQDKKDRLDRYTTLTNAYYNLATDFYEYGWGSSFHFSRYYKGEPFYQAIARHEHYLALKMGLKEGDKVLDVGCGVGGPAREICSFSGANITGLNNNDYQIARATNYSAKRGLSHKLNFVKGDFMNMQFKDETFDAVYAIEATVHAPTLAGVYGEIFRVLKPGGVFGVYEWVMTDDYDATNPEHRQIAYGIELGDGIPQMVKASDAVEALKSVGFEILHDEDLANKGDEIPWYYPIAGELKHVRSLGDLVTVGRMTKVGRSVAHKFVGALEKVGLAPKGSQKVGDALATAADALVEGGRKNLFTPMQLYICRKPESK
ncbi:Delta(24)-sterol C-methyltransferase [Saitoella coloradoensis]